jgi:hypothetical protein
MFGVSWIAPVISLPHKIENRRKAGIECYLRSRRDRKFRPANAAYWLTRAKYWFAQAE